MSLALIYIHDNVNLNAYEQELRKSWENLFQTYNGLNQGWSRKVEIVNIDFPKSPHVSGIYTNLDRKDLPILFFAQMTAQGKIDHVYGYIKGTPDYDQIDEGYKQIFLYDDKAKQEVAALKKINEQIEAVEWKRSCRRANNIAIWTIGALVLMATTLVITNKG